MPELMMSMLYAFIFIALAVLLFVFAHRYIHDVVSCTSTNSRSAVIFL